MTRHVIVGLGVAGISAAETLRRLDPSAEITLIGDDKHGGAHASEQQDERSALRGCSASQVDASEKNQGKHNRAYCGIPHVDVGEIKE